MSLRTFTLGAVVLVAGCLAASACGVRSVADCSGGRYDGHGGCIPKSHAPPLVEAAAIRRFHGEVVDRVGCYVIREFSEKGVPVTVWGCWRVAHGLLTRDVTCVAATDGLPLDRAARAAIPAHRLRCAA